MEAFDAVWGGAAWAESREHAWVRVVEASRRRQTYDLPLLVEATLEARRARSAGLRWFVDVLGEGAAHPFANPCYRSLADELERQVGRGLPPATPPDPRAVTDGDDPRALGLAACRTLEWDRWLSSTPMVEADPDRAADLAELTWLGGLRQDAVDPRWIARRRRAAGDEVGARVWARRAATRIYANWEARDDEFGVVRVPRLDRVPGVPEAVAVPWNEQRVEAAMEAVRAWRSDHRDDPLPNWARWVEAWAARDAGRDDEAADWLEAMVAHPEPDDRSWGLVAQALGILVDHDLGSGRFDPGAPADDRALAHVRAAEDRHTSPPVQALAWGAEQVALTDPWLATRWAWTVVERDLVPGDEAADRAAAVLASLDRPLRDPFVVPPAEEDMIRLGCEIAPAELQVLVAVGGTRRRPQIVPLVPDLGDPVSVDLRAKAAGAVSCLAPTARSADASGSYTVTNADLGVAGPEGCLAALLEPWGGFHVVFAVQDIR